MTPPAENRNIHERISELELAGRHREVIELCEAAASSKDADAEVHLAVSRSCFALATLDNEFFAWPALFAALDGLEKFTAGRANMTHAIGICRWVLDLFADPERFDVPQFTERQAGFHSNATWWNPPATERAANPERDELERLHRHGEFVQLCNRLFAAAPPTIRFGRSKDSSRREAQYLMANLFTALDGERIGDLLANEPYPLPGDYEAQPYDNYLQKAALIRRQQVRAQAAGVPGFLVTSIPKSASEFLCSTVAECTGAAIARVSIGDPLLGSIHAKWVAEVRQGGCITHDHFAASGVNLKALCDGGADRIAVLVRDPRAAFWSREKMYEEYDSIAPETRLEKDLVCRRVKRLADWIETWVCAKAGGFTVDFIRFRELTAQPEEVMSRILTEAGAERFIPNLREVLQKRADRQYVSSNFRKGDDDAWRKHVPPELQTAIWDVIPHGVRDLLGLKP